jgi:hypothetical protein
MLKTLKISRVWWQISKWILKIDKQIDSWKEKPLHVFHKIELLGKNEVTYHLLVSRLRPTQIFQQGWHKQDHKVQLIVIANQGLQQLNKKWVKLSNFISIRKLSILHKLIMLTFKNPKIPNLVPNMLSIFLIFLEIMNHNQMQNQIIWENKKILMRKWDQYWLIGL